MGTLAELSNSVSSLIQAHPSMKADLDILLSQIANLDVPEIGIQIDEGRIQLVERFNDAPFKIYVHEHGVEGTEEKPFEQTGRASCRERVCKDVKNPVGARSLKKKKKK